MTAEDALLTEEATTFDLPAPRSARSHVNYSIEVPPRPHEDRDEAGHPHPSHRATSAR